MPKGQFMLATGAGPWKKASINNGAHEVGD